MKCCVLSIGYELLQGRVVNTNAAYIARRLTLLGHAVKAIVSVGDNFDDIFRAFDFCLKALDCELIISTGGLGPTPDDITLEAVAKYFGLPLELHPKAYEEIRRKYEAQGMSLTEERIKMAKLPRGAVPLENPVGIAPGIMLKISFNNRERTIIALPGVPKEMEAIFSKHIEPMLRGSKMLIEAEFIVIPGIESSLAPLIKHFSRTYPDIYIKSHPEGHEIREPRVRIYISLYDENAERGLNTCNNALKNLINEILTKLGSKVEIVKPCSIT